MLNANTMPNIGGERHITRQARSIFFRMLLSFLDRKLNNHLDFFSGSQNIPAKGPVIIVPNHQSYFDGFAITSLVWRLTHRKIYIPTNIKALTNPITTFLQVSGGAVPINPADKSETYARLTALLKQGEAVVIYPEGTRSDGSFLHPFKFGAFNLAVETGVPILPVSVRNFANILPRGSMRFRREQTGSIVFGELINPSAAQYQGHNKREIAAHICAEVRNWIERTTFSPPGSENIKTIIYDEVSALARRADAELEALLDQNVELISRQDADRVLEIISTKNILNETSFNLDIQELRAVGFRLRSMSRYRALLELRRYRTLLNTALSKDSDHAYLNYCIGLLHLELPPLLGGGDIRDAVKHFKAAHSNAEHYNYPKNRFAHGYATALSRQGKPHKALSILKGAFDGPKQLKSLRELRRRERGMTLMRKLQNIDKTDSSHSKRSLRGFETIMAQTRISDVVIGQIDGITDFSQIFDAASALQKRHPGLRARVVWPEGRDNRPIFEYLPADELRLHVHEIRPDTGQNVDPRAFWESVAETEVNHLFDLSEGYMFRVTWLPESGHVILNAQHAVVDGISLMRLLHEFAAHCAGEDIGPELPPTLSALESCQKINLLEKVVGWFHREFFIRARARFQDWSPLPIAGRLEKGMQLKTECYFADGDATNFRSITNACRENGVTVGSAYAAAIQCAMLHFSQSSFETSAKYYVPMDISLRRYIPDGNTSQETIGFFSGSSPVILKGDPALTFWELAKKFGDKSKGEINTKSPLIFHQVFDRFFNLEKSYEKYNLHCTESGGAGGPLTMSNVGAFPYDPKTGKIRINTLHGMSASQKAGAMLYFWLRSINGRFFYSATAINPASTRDFGEIFFSFVVFLMENCLSPSASNKAIRDYIPEAAALHRDTKSGIVSSSSQPELVA